MDGAARCDLHFLRGLALGRRSGRCLEEQRSDFKREMEDETWMVAIAMRVRQRWKFGRKRDKHTQGLR